MLFASVATATLMRYDLLLTIFWKILLVVVLLPTAALVIKTLIDSFKK